MKRPFTLNDFRLQFQAIKKMGAKDMANMPGMAGMMSEGEDPDAALDRVGRMIDAMTDEERNDPAIIDDERRQRIAATAGVQPDDVSAFLKQFDMIRALMDEMNSMSFWQRLKLVLGLGRFPRSPPPDPT